jgi:hypothetical protein
VTDRTVGADENQVVSNEWIPVEAVLFAVLFDVVAPALLPGLSIEGVEGAGARADEYQVPGDRRGGPDSAAGFKLPADLRVRSLAETRGRDNQQRKSQDGCSIDSHLASLQMT